MAKLTRKNMKLFGLNAGPTQIGQFGSMAAGSPAYSTDPDTIQSLSNYLSGWYAAILVGNAPAIQDMNALFYLYAYQLFYLFEMGVSEWNASTTYYIGSLVNSAGNLYASLVDDNLNNAITDTTKWRNVSGGPNVVAINPATQSPYTLVPSTDHGKTFLVNTANGAMQFNLPATAPANFNFKVKDVGGSAAAYPVTIVVTGAITIEGLNSNFVCEAAYGDWDFVCDATNYWLVD